MLDVETSSRNVSFAELPLVKNSLLFVVGVAMLVIFDGEEISPRLESDPVDKKDVTDSVIRISGDVVNKVVESNFELFDAVSIVTVLLIVSRVEKLCFVSKVDSDGMEVNSFAVVVVDAVSIFGSIVGRLVSVLEVTTLVIVPLV